MRKKLKQILSEEGNKKILRQFFGLGAMQALSNVIQLITIPYATRKVGMDLFGISATALAIANYLVTFTDFGFYLTATKEIAAESENRKKVSEIYAAVMGAKGLLAFISLVFLGILIATVPNFKTHWQVYLASYGMVVGGVLFPNWLFTGLEKLREYAYSIIGMRLLYVAFIFLFIQDKGDYIWLNFWYGVSQIVVSVYLIFWAYRRLHLQFLVPDFIQVWQQLKSSTHAFSAWFTNYLYANANVVILSVFAHPTYVGYYALAEKVISGIGQIYNILFQISYPKACSTFETDKLGTQRFLKKTFLATESLLGITSLLVFVFAEYVVRVLAASYSEEGTIILRIMCLVPLAKGLGIRAYQNLLLYDLRKEYSRIYLYGTVLSLGLCTLLTYNFLHFGTASSILVTEVAISLALISVDHKKGSRSFI